MPECTENQALEKLREAERNMRDVEERTKSVPRIGNDGIAVEKLLAEAQRELDEARYQAKLQELDHLKSAFVSIASHELRTPMTSIKGYVENMLDGLTGELTEEQADSLERVKHNVDRLTRMINELLDLSKIEAGRMELHLVPVSLLDVAG